MFPQTVIHQDGTRGPVPYVVVSLLVGLRTGQKPTPETVRRWVEKGVDGVRLNAIKLQGAWRCTEADLDEFIRARTAAAIRNAEAAP